eukprot:scaffold13118_cov79-Skeletonema_dohrnii-CCMP3373.AAC.1
MAELHAEIETLIIRSAEKYRDAQNSNFASITAMYKPSKNHIYHYLDEIREHEKTIDWLNEA